MKKHGGCKTQRINPVEHAAGTGDPFALTAPDAKCLGGEAGLVAQGTIEERILAQQERKAALAESMYRRSVGRKQPLFSESDLVELLKPLSV